MAAALVLSRLAGAARELSDAILINPYAIDEFAEALRLALTMPVEEQQQRMARLRGKLRTTMSFDGPALSCPKPANWGRLASSSRCGLQPRSLRETQFAGALAEMVESYRGGTSLALLFDYDGTLVLLLRVLTSPS